MLGTDIALHKLTFNDTWRPLMRTLLENLLMFGQPTQPDTPMVLLGMAACLTALAVWRRTANH